MLLCQTEASFASSFKLSLLFSLPHPTFCFFLSLSSHAIRFQVWNVFLLLLSRSFSSLGLVIMKFGKKTYYLYECHHQANVSHIGIGFYRSLCNSLTQSLQNVTANYFASRLARDEVPIIWMIQTLKLTALSVPWLRLCPCWCKFMPLKSFSAPLFTQ